MTQGSTEYVEAAIALAATLERSGCSLEAIRTVAARPDDPILGRFIEALAQTNVPTEPSTESSMALLSPEQFEKFMEHFFRNKNQNQKAFLRPFVNLDLLALLEPHELDLVRHTIFRPGAVHYAQRVEFPESYQRRTGETRDELVYTLLRAQDRIKGTLVQRFHLSQEDRARNHGDMRTLAETSLSTRARNALNSLYVKYLVMLSDWTVRDLARLPGVGPERVKDIVAMLREEGRSIQLKEE